MNIKIIIILVQVLIQAKKFTRRCRSEILDSIRATHCPKMPSSEAVNTYRVPNTGPTVESGLLIVKRHWHHRKGEKNYLYKLDQQGKTWATKTQ
jgi:hypothetical protein